MKKVVQREFLNMINLIGVISITFIIGCAWFEYISQEPEIGLDAYSIKEDALEVFLSKVPELIEAGRAVTIVEDDLSNHLIIVQVEKNEYVIASSHCTHRGMALAYNHKNKRFRCSSAGKSEFNLDGSIVKGPAKKALKIYDSFLKGDTLIIDLLE